MKFRKKPVVIDAIQFNDENFGAIMRFCPELQFMQHPVTDKMHGIIPTLEGMMEVQEYDWVIKGLNGEFYPCKPDIFVMTYELV